MAFKFSFKLGSKKEAAPARSAPKLGAKPAPWAAPNAQAAGRTPGPDHGHGGAQAAPAGIRRPARRPAVRDSRRRIRRAVHRRGGDRVHRQSRGDLRHDLRVHLGADAHAYAAHRQGSADRADRQPRGVQAAAAVARRVHRRAEAAHPRWRSQAMFPCRPRPTPVRPQLEALTKEWEKTDRSVQLVLDAEQEPDRAGHRGAPDQHQQPDCCSISPSRSRR